MKPGTIIRLPDGREGTVTYHGLDGYGIMFGRHEIDMTRYLNTNPLFGEAPENWPYHPNAMLRKPDVKHLFPRMECVGEEYVLVKDSEDPEEPEEISKIDDAMKHVRSVRREGRTVVFVCENTGSAIGLFKFLELKLAQGVN